VNHRRDYSGKPRSTLNRVLRDHFARFLGEVKAKPPHGSAHHRTVPLWGTSRDYYPLFRKRQSSLDLVQAAVNEIFERIRVHNWNAYVVGGALRDLLVEPSRSGHFSIAPRDIDVVVTDATNSELINCFADLIARHTRFGGLHLVKSIGQICEVHFDIWTLADTWAFKEFGVKPEIARFPSTPFFNLDSVAIELFPKARRPRTIYEQGFYEGIGSKLIDVNFEKNPFPDVCVIRALIMAARLQYALSRRLACFISSWSNQQPNPLATLERAQLSHYGQMRCSSYEVGEWLGSVQQQLKEGSERVEIRVSHSRQLGLWIDYPPVQRDHASGQKESGAPFADGLNTESEFDLRLP
jgi:hypothetical protein